MLLRVPILVTIAIAVAAGALRSNRADGAANPGVQSPGGGAAIRPFTIDVPEPVLIDLKERLARARFPDEVDGAGWDYGSSLAYMKELVGYWHAKFDWREQERRLNRFEQFKTNIDGLDVHFVHRRSKSPNPMALMLVHGWPSSFMQFHKVIEPLTDPASHGSRPEDAFDLVIPSIPGYGFSDKPRKPGHDSRQTAAMFVELMARLGYRRYGVQGADVGYGIVTAMATMDAAHVVGLHTETCRSGPPPDRSDPTVGVPPSELERMRERQAFFSPEETAYQNIQRTKPQTLGFGLDDSPVGQAAWIIEKFRAWSDGDGNVEKQFTKDELLTNITIYWVTKTGSSSSLSYGGGGRPRNQPRAQAQGNQPPRIEVPTACVSWPKDVGFTPKLWNERRYNLKRFTLMPRGGHFGAFEEPQLYVEDVRAFFRDLRQPVR